MTDLETKILDAFYEIAKGQGAYNQDPIIHAENCIEDMVGIAKSMITLIEINNP